MRVRRPPAPARHRRASSTGCRRTSRATSTAWPASTAPHCTSTPTPARAGTPTGARHLQLRAPRGALLPRLERAVLARPRSTSTGCGSTPSRRCSTSTTPARPASGSPTATAAGRTSRPSTFLRELNTACTRSTRRGRPIAEESTAWPMVTRPTEWAVSGSRSSGTWAGCTTRSVLRSATRPPPLHHDELTFSLRLRLQRALRAAAVPRRGRAREGLAAQQDAGRRLAAARNLRALYGVQWAQPGKKLLFMGGELGQWDGVDRRRLARLVPARRSVARGRPPVLSPTSTAAYRGEPALWEVSTSGPDGSQWARRRSRREHDHRARLSARLQPRNGLVCVTNFSPACGRAGGCRSPRGGAWREVLNTDSAPRYAGAWRRQRSGRRRRARRRAQRPAVLGRR